MRTLARTLTFGAVALAAFAAADPASARSVAQIKASGELVMRQ